MREKDSVAIYFVHAMLYGLREQPACQAQVLERAGIDPQLLGQAQARVPGKAFAALWLLMITERGEEFFGLDSHGMPKGSFALICRGLILEPDLGKALRQYLQGFALFVRDIRAHVQVRGQRAVISLDYQSELAEARGFAEETFLVLMISMLCWLGGRRITIDRVDFHHQRASLEDDPLLWGPNLNFGAERTEIEFASDYLSLPVVQDFAALKSFLRGAPQWLMIRYRNSRGPVSQVYRRLRNSQYGQWPTLPAMAVQLGLSATTFRRQLERAGCSYQQLKDEVRRAMAFERLRDTALSIAEIAEQTGFQEPSAFHRAFKKWTGESPGHYRQRTQRG
ncbi:MAG: AraC family transcriptional regulator [Pseudomonas sp.]|uniref:AraC family transcriptional regulator n=1 Tax=Pseudomonas abieticivorans TaxID=2931382 RepID=UPI0020C01D27|nr:AraC family transcriptional regulator [Pseudomonas sp. PIA16]MDE1164778.1 AraC family transcriptional regulator [Pseudomonas sp.]